MANKKKPDPSAREGEASDRAVLKRAGEPVSADVPDAGEFEAGKKIKAVDLSLHGDGISDWQDEPISVPKKSRDREAKG